VSGLEILVVIGIVGFVIYQQLAGQPLQGKRLVVLPAVVTVLGFFDLRGHHMGPADIAWLTVGAAGSLLIGLAFGLITRLESRDGVLWGKMPLRGLWLWAALVAWRVLVMVLASGMHAHVAASTATLLLTLGINRVAQAAVIMPRAMAMGVPFAPEKDGRSFMADTITRGAGSRYDANGRHGAELSRGSI
jgi:hypothetical protein